MAAETVPSRAEQQKRRGGAYWFDIVLGRLLPACFFSVFLVDKLLLVAASVSRLQAAGAQATDYLYAVNQLLGLAYFSLLVVLYIVRLPKRAGDARPWVIVASLFGTFAIILASFLPGVEVRRQLLLASVILVMAGLAYSIWSLGYLRRSFSILPEARRLVTGGPYRLSRHPLYLGEAVAGIALVVPTLGWPGLLLIVFYLTAQYLRIRAEERVLAGEFPEYADYRRRVPRYLPNPLMSLRST